MDDDQRFRKGLQTLLDFYNNNGTFRFEIVGEAATSLFNDAQAMLNKLVDEKLIKARADLDSRVVTTMVMEEMSTPRDTAAGRNTAKAARMPMPMRFAESASQRAL